SVFFVPTSSTPALYTLSLHDALPICGPVHCAEPSNDGIVYVCDRTNDRLQMFTMEGKFLNEVQIQPESKGDGSTWDVEFSKDPRSEEHTSELQSLRHLVCRLLLEKKK